MTTSCGQPHETQDYLESFRSPGPVLSQGIGPGTVGDGTQDERDDDDIVGVTQYRDEVRDQVDGQEQVRHQ